MHYRRLWFALLAWLFVMGSTTLWARDGVWRGYGPFAPDVNVILQDRTDANHIYLGSLGSGVFKSEDGGERWQATGLLGNPYVNALVQTATLAKTLFAATRGGVFTGSDDANQWQGYNSGLTEMTVLDLALKPNAEQTLFAATSNGIFKRQADDTEWRPVNDGLTNTFVTTLRFDPNTVTQLYAGGSGGVYLSTDDGESWQPRNEGLSRVPVRTLLIQAGTSPSTLYAGTNKGVYRSLDGGLSWHYRSTGMPLTTVSALVVDPTFSVTLYAGTGGGVYISTDEGANWQLTAAAPANPTIRTLATDAHSGLLYAGTSGGLHASHDGGTTWQTTNNGVGAATINDLVVAVDGRLYAGSTKGVFVSHDDGLTWVTVNSGLIDLVVQGLAVDPQHADLLYAGVLLGNGLYKSSDGGAHWQLSRSGIPSATDVYAVAIDPLTPSTLYAGTSRGVYKSSDRAASWQAATTGLGKTTIQAFAIHPLTTTQLSAKCYRRLHLLRQLQTGAEIRLFCRIFVIAFVAPHLANWQLLSLFRRMAHADACQQASLTIPIARIVELTDMALRGGSPLLQRRCLTRSLTLYYLLHRAGFAVEVHIGLANEEYTYAAHSWLVRDGLPFAEHVDPRQHFIAIHQIT